MVHLRAFSFTDDSANVTLPNQQYVSSGAKSPFTHNLGPAMHLLKLRNIQSEFYQKLYFSSHMPFETMWPLMSNSISRMDDYLHDLPDQISKQSKRTFRYEVSYANLLALTPPGWVDALPDDGIRLAFKSAIEYAETLSSIMTDSEGFVFYTSHDLLRASFVAERFVTLLSRHSVLLMGFKIPQVAPSRVSVAQPPASVYGGESRIVDQARRCLGLFENVLQALGSRYGYPDPLTEFKMSSTGVRQVLEVNMMRSG